jgi:flagellar hook assembly protein FlgD
MFIKIYDILGREVSTLVNEQLKPGTYEVNWDGSNFASGIYFYSLQTGKFSETKKMILMK